MRRRDLFEVGAALAAPQVTRAQTAGRARMKLGTQHGDSDEILRVMAAFWRESYLQPYSIQDAG